MDINVDHDSEITLYQQLHTQFLEKFAKGELIAGAKLPTVRQFAADLHVAPYTVARLYRSLEADGFVETRGRNGTVVCARSDSAQTLLQQAASDYASRAGDLGLGPDEALDYIRRALGR